MNFLSNSNNHPLIPNSNNYLYEQRYVSIHSNDRDVVKYPRSAEFEIELPQDYTNIVSARLHSWSIPSNYNVFSIQNFNIFMTFQFSTLYDPNGNTFVDVSHQLVSEAFKAALEVNQDKNYVVIIEQGFYNPDQMAVELTKKFNEVVNNTIVDFFNSPEGIANYSQAYTYYQSTDPTKPESPTNPYYLYDRFVIAYNTVNQKMWFGNKGDKFILTNEYLQKQTSLSYSSNCIRRNYLPDSTNWGLPSNLGFNRCNSTAITTEEAYTLGQIYNPPFIADNAYPLPYPRFYYGDAYTYGDNGYWVIPDDSCPGSTVYYIQAPYKINLMGQAYVYMEIDGLNCLDETSPYNLSTFTLRTNQTNGVVNSSFAKIALYSTPISQLYDQITQPFKYFSPPAERLRKLKIKLRYHDGEPVDFGVFEYSFMIEFNMLRPQNLRSHNIQNSIDLSQMQSKM